MIKRIVILQRRIKLKGISPILSALIFLTILMLSLGLLIYTINEEANYSAQSIQYLKTVSQEPMIFETWHNGVVELATNRPFVITHIILPNGQILNTSMMVQNVIPLGDILVDNASWAIIVTNTGEWYNVSLLNLPPYTQLDPEGLYYGIPWNSTVLKNVGFIPNWYVTQGVKMLNFSATKINAFAGYNQAYGVTNVLAVTYPGNVTNGWVNITFYAPVHYTGNVPNPYFWDYYTQIAPLSPSNPSPSFNPYNHYYYYLLVTTNPYAWMMPPIWYSAIYANATFKGGGPLGLGYYYETNYTNPRGAINFTYAYVNVTLGVYVPIYNISNGNIGYLYIPITVFEITDVAAYVPSEVYGSVYQVNPGFTIQKRPVNITGGQWVYIPYSWIVAPIQQAPYLGYTANTKAYTIPSTFDSPFVPPYVDFPMENYVGFPSYVGYNYSWLYIHLYATNDTIHYKTIKIAHILRYGRIYYTYETIPDYTALTFPALYLDPTSYKYAVNGNPNDLVTCTWNVPFLTTGDLNGVITPASPWNVKLLNQTNDPIKVYELAINMYTGQILLYGLDPNTGNWILIMHMTVTYPSSYSGFEFVHYLPIYIVAPYGTYLLGAGATGNQYQSVYKPPNG